MLAAPKNMADIEHFHIQYAPDYPCQRREKNANNPKTRLILYIFTCRGDSRRGVGLDIGFIDLFNPQLGTTSNCSAIANLRTLQITRAHAKSFPVCCVFTSRTLVTALTVEILQLPRSSPLFTDSHTELTWLL
jgi:hypothetical protein